MGEFSEFNGLDHDYKPFGPVCIRRDSVAYATPSGVNDGTLVVLTTTHQLRVAESYKVIRAWLYDA